MNDFVIAKYIRLSVDDGITESSSIAHQHLLLNRHIEELGLLGDNTSASATILEFVDNGYTGTNMNRPALQEMLNMVRSGRINCIVVKDFTRFSRNALESGYYIEQVFPLHRIRFISIGDNFDSNNHKDDTGGIEVAFKFVMSEYYSQDLSKKVKSAKRVKMARGEYIVANAIYGYRKNPETKKWELDDEAADVVRLIFEMALDGLPCAIIRGRLFEARYPTPKEYVKAKRGEDIAPKYLWETHMVRKILTNEQYAGSYVSGKQYSKAIGSHSRGLTDKSEWIIIPNSHPPIVSKEVFDRVQHLMATQLKYARSIRPAELWQISTTKCHVRHRGVLSGRINNQMPIYGYTKTADFKWRVDETAAKVVRKIYDLVLQGYLVNEIRVVLTNEKHPIPRDYKKIAKGQSIIPSHIWTNASIHRILKDEQLTGVRTLGKFLLHNETGKTYKVPKEQWVIIPDTHPAIISKETFEQVQEIIASNQVPKNTPTFRCPRLTTTNQNTACHEKQAKQLMEKKQALYEQFIMGEIDSYTYQQHKIINFREL